MYQFTKTTVINTNTDYTTGLPLFKAEAAGGKVPTAYLEIKRHAKFLKPNIVSISKAVYSEPKIAKATLDLAQLGATEGTYRIAMYIKLSLTSANSYYANDLVFKGKPLYIEFVWKNGEAAATVAAKVAKIVKKYFIAVYEKSLVKVSADGTKVIIDGTDEYQRFTKVDIEKYTEGTEGRPGAFVVLKSAMPTSQSTDPDYNVNFTIEQGKDGFGTYQYVLKNLRLPTAANTSWTAINKDEAPILGAKYNEYVIRQCVDRGVMGGDAVGEITKSLTTHVFFVNQTVSGAFETALTTVAPEGGIVEAKETPADPAPASTKPDPGHGG